MHHGLVCKNMKVCRRPTIPRLLHPGRKRGAGEDVFCHECGKPLPPGTTVRYSPLSGSSYCDRHGKAIQRGIRRLIATEKALREAVAAFPAILMYLDVHKIRLILDKRCEEAAAAS